jgi:hypothetical protein
MNTIASNTIQPNYSPEMRRMLINPEQHSRYDILRQEQMDLLEDPRNLYHLTVTFEKGRSDAYYLDAFNEIIRRLNRLCQRRGYFKKDQIIQGLTVFERAMNKRDPYSNELHFHTIIRDVRGDLPSYHVMNTMIATVISKITGKGSSKEGKKLMKAKKVKEAIKAKNSKRPKKPKKRLIGDECWLLQDYYNKGDSRLEGYLGEMHDRPSISYEEKKNLIGALDEFGANFSDNNFSKEEPVIISV